MSTQGLSMVAQRASFIERIRPGLHRFEDLTLSIAFGLMMLLPLLETLLRKTLHTGLSGNASVVQHLVLILGMVGAAIAARKNELLPLSTLDKLLPAKTAAASRLFRGAVSVAVASCLAFASYQFLVTERESGHFLVYHLPVWLFELAFPFGFLGIAVRLLHQSASHNVGRAATLVLAAAICTAAWFGSSSSLVMAGLIALACAGLLGAPAFVLLGGTALLLFWKLDQPIAAIPIAHYSLV